MGALIVGGLFFVSTIVFGWTDPGGSPPSGDSGSVSVDASGNVNIGVGLNVGAAAAPASTVSVTGNMSVGTNYAGTAAPVDSVIIEGSLGVGTNNPATPLDVFGVGTLGGIRVGGTGISVGSGYGGATIPADGAIVEGNVGIGTNDPQSALQIGSVGQTGIFFQPPNYNSLSQPSGANICSSNSHLGRLAVNTNFSAGITAIWVCVRTDAAGNYGWKKAVLTN